MGYHYGPSADLLVLVCVRHEPLWHNSHPFEDTLEPVLPRSSVQGGLMRSERKHGLCTEPVPVSAYVGSSKSLKDLQVTSESKYAFSAVLLRKGASLGYVGKIKT